MTPLPYFTNIPKVAKGNTLEVKNLEFLAELYSDEYGEIHRRNGEGEWIGVSKDSSLYKSLEVAYQKTKREAKLKRITNG